MFVLPILPFFICLSACAAEAVPTAEDINRLAETAKTASGVFVRRSQPIRMQFECSGDFLTWQERQKLKGLAESADRRLAQIEEEQRTFKKQIEDYQGEDWEQRFGSTGLWRKLAADVLRTTLSRLDVDYYLALADEEPKRSQLLHGIVTQIDSLSTNEPPAYAQFIKAKSLALLSQSDAALVPAAANEFDRLMLHSYMSQATAFKVSIEKIKFLGPETNARLDTLADDLARSQSRDDIELVLSLASLQRGYAPQALEKTLSLWPDIETLLAQLILADLSNAAEQADTNEPDLTKITAIEAELAAKAASSARPEKCRAVLEGIVATEKFQTPAVLYAAGSAFSHFEPERAVELLIKASGLQERHKSSRLDIEPGQIAEEAARLAYRLYEKGSDNCRLAVEAFDNYAEIAAGQIDPRLEYLYAVVLKDCGQKQKSEKLLEKIAQRPTGPERNRARLVLIKQKLNRPGTIAKQNAILEELRNLILDCNCPPGDTGCILVRDEAAYLYCRTLLDFGDKQSARKVLDLLDNPILSGFAMSKLFKSQALQQAGRLEQAVQLMADVVSSEASGSAAPQIVELLSNVLDNCEPGETCAGKGDTMLRNCVGLAEYADRFVRSRRSSLILAEFNLLAAKPQKSNLDEIQRTLSTCEKRDDINWLRCRARLLGAEDKFERSAELWAQIARIRRDDEPSPDERSWQWWRAKYYELYCLAQPPNAEKGNIIHTIEVLENTFTRIPPPWAEKLGLLKRQQSNRPGFIHRRPVQNVPPNTPRYEHP